MTEKNIEIKVEVEDTETGELIAKETFNSVEGMNNGIWRIERGINNYIKRDDN